MPILYADSAGNLIRFTQSDLDEVMRGKPAGAVYSVDFDPATNRDLGPVLLSDFASFSMPGGTLQRNGQPYAINAPTPDYQTQQLIARVANALSTGQFQGANVTLSQANADWQAIQVGTATGTQQQRFLVALGRVVGYDLKRLLAAGLV